MVKKGSSRRSSKQESQISSFKRLSLLDPAPSEPQTPEEGPGSLSDRVYLHAAAIFQNTHLQKPPAHRLISYGKRSEVSLPVARDETCRRLAYQLAFNTLKYQELLEDVLIDSCFCLSQPMSEDWMSLVAVMFTDLLDRKFLPRIQTANQEEVQEVREVEACLLRFKIKLVASLARCRIKHELLTLDNILPHNIRHKQDQASHLPLYTWLNTHLSSLEEVSAVLHTSGFSCVKSLRQLTGQTFCKDPHCQDLLVFPNSVKTELIQTGLLTDYRLIIQDKSCCLGPWALRPLLAEGGDVLMAGRLSALTVAHVSAVAASAHTHTDTHTPLSAQSNNTVFVCVGEETLSRRDELQKILQTLGCTNVKLLTHSLHTLDVGDVTLQKVAVIFLKPVCSLSAVSNPVDYILQENADPEIMLDLSRDSISPAKLQTLTCQQRKDLQRAFIFPKVRAVLYFTCSMYSEENEELVNRVLTESQEISTAPPYRWSDPGLQQDSLIDDEESEKTKINFFKLEASNDSNGCFLALLTRQPEQEVTETQQEVLARAAASGLLDGVLPKQPIRKQGRGRKAPAKQTRSRQTRPHASQSDQSRIDEFLRREMKGSRSEASVTRQNISRTQPSSDPSHNKPAGSQRPPQGVSPRTGSSPNPASFSSSSHRSLKHSVVSTVSANGRLSSGSVTRPPALPKPRQYVLQPATISFPPVMFPQDILLPQRRRSHALPAVRSSPAHMYLQCSSSTPALPRTRTSFRASFHYLQP